MTQLFHLRHTFIKRINFSYELDLFHTTAKTKSRRFYNCFQNFFDNFLVGDTKVFEEIEKRRNKIKLN